MLRAEKVATPPTAATGPPPVSVPPPGFVPIARVTFPVNVVAVCPSASCAVTFTAGVIAAPAVVLLGGTVNTSWVGVTVVTRSEEHTSELQSRLHLVCRLLLEK